MGSRFPPSYHENTLLDPEFKRQGQFVTVGSNCRADSTGLPVFRGDPAERVADRDSLDLLANVVEKVAPVTDDEMTTKNFERRCAR